MVKTSQPQRWCVRVSDGRYVKRTSHFGIFHGSIILTSDPKDIRYWSRESDALRAARVFNSRLLPDRLNQTDLNKFGPLIATHEEGV